MPSCSIKWCATNSKSSGVKRDGISFHKFPKIAIIKERWLEATQRKNWYPQHHSSICSRHFTPDCFDDSKKLRRLFSSAVPTLFLPVLISPNGIPLNKHNVSIPVNNTSVKIECDANEPDSSHQNVPVLPNVPIKIESDESESDSSHQYILPDSSQDSCNSDELPNNTPIKTEYEENEPDPSPQHNEPRFAIINNDSMTTLTNLQNEDLSPRERWMKKHIEHLIYTLNKKKKDVKRLQDKTRKQAKKIEQLKVIVKNLKEKCKNLEED